MTGTLLRRGVGAAAVAFALLGGSAQQAPAQTSQLNIVGSVNIFQVRPGVGENLVIDFLPNGGGVGTVETCCFPGDQTGVFAILPPTAFPGVQTDLVFGPAAAPPPTTTPFVLLVIDGFTFTATTLGPGNTGTPIFLQQVGNTVFASLNATGTVTGPGLLGPTPFIGGYSTQFPNTTIAQLVGAIEAGTTLSKSVSATFTVGVIPEPSTYVLMATGLVGLFGAARLRRRATV